MDTNTILFLIALIGCFVGLAGYLSGRDKKIVNDAEWKGTVNTKLDLIIGVNQTVINHEKRLTEVEQSTKSAHHRIDGLGDKNV